MTPGWCGPPEIFPKRLEADFQNFRMIEERIQKMTDKKLLDGITLKLAEQFIASIRDQLGKENIQPIKYSVEDDRFSIESIRIKIDDKREVNIQMWTRNF